MKTVITGGAGFIGCNLAEFYARKGDSVVVVDNLSYGNKNYVVNAENNF